MALKLALLTNLVAPYRRPLYEALADAFDLRIFVSGEEDNRRGWSGAGGDSLDVRRAGGATFRYRVRGDGAGVFDHKYLHLTPGYLVELLRFRPDAVITTEMGFRTLLALAYGRLSGVPVWVWWGGTLHTERDVGRLKRSVRGRLARWVRRWISYGATSTEYLLQLGVPRARILQIQNCVDEGLFRQPADPKFAYSPGPVLLYVGQLIGRKGVDRLLRAAAALQREGLQFSLVLVGAGPEEEALRRLAAPLRNVHFHGTQPPQSMPSVYRSGDCLVFPTLEDVWGLVVNEALWSSIPVVASCYAGCAAEILPPQNVFDPLDELDFEAALRRVVDGEVGSADTSRLLPSAAVAGMLVEDVRARTKCRK